MPSSSQAPGAAADLRQNWIKSPRRRQMAAVCEQLGERRVSVRKVCRVTGGSHRDVGPVVKLWREHHDAVAATLNGKDPQEALQAIGAIVLTAMDQLREVQVAPAAVTQLTAAVARLESQLTRQRSAAAGLAQQSAVDRQFQSLTARLETLARKVDDAPLVSTPDPSEALDRAVQSLQAAWAAWTTRVDTERLEPLQQALHALERRVESLAVTPAPAPSVSASLLEPLERRVESMSDALTRLSAQLQQRLAPRRRAKKLQARAASRPATRPTPTNARTRRRPRPRPTARTTARGSRAPAIRAKPFASAKRPKTRAPQQRRRTRAARPAASRAPAPRAARRGATVKGPRSARPLTRRRAPSPTGGRARGARARRGHGTPRRNPRR
jgi:hypothetical protein